ncbi:MAG: TolC family protein [Parachlamydiales bacterium]|nr:TolC family protein [Parachlamydiales bacterium]
MSHLLVFIAMNVGPLFSEEDPLNGSSLPLNTLIGEVLKRNPDLEAARDRIRAAAEVVSRVQVIDDPEFRFMSDYNNFKANSEFLPMLQYQISQTFPFPGKLGLKGKVAEEVLKQFQSQEIITERDLVLQTKKLYFQLFFNRASDQINQHNRELVKNLIDASLALYKSGLAGYEEVAKVQIELQVLDEQWLTIEADRIFIVSLLNAILDRPPKSTLGPPIDDFKSSMNVPVDNLESLAIRNRPELKEIQAMVDEQQMMARLAKREYFPDIIVSAGYEQMTRNRKDNAWEASIGFKIPLWVGLRQKRQVREAEARASAGMNALRGMEARIRGQIQEILGQLTASEERFFLYETGLLPKIREALKASESSYRSGKGGFLFLLDTRRQYQDISLEYERVRAERESLMAELERAIGVPWEEMQ